jgi:hypothetical protein
LSARSGWCADVALDAWQIARPQVRERAGTGDIGRQRRAARAPRPFLRARHKRERPSNITAADRDPRPHEVQMDGHAVLILCGLERLQRGLGIGIPAPPEKAPRQRDARRREQIRLAGRSRGAERGVQRALRFVEPSQIQPRMAGGDGAVQQEGVVSPFQRVRVRLGEHIVDVLRPSTFQQR